MKAGPRAAVLVLLAGLAGGIVPPLALAQDAGSSRGLPLRLSDTGLFDADTKTIRADNLAYAPQYPLWSDGASKRRWIHLPPGAVIDAANPDAWEFPPGTKLWKEFRHGRAIETRYIERAAGGDWRYAVYIWNADGSDALLAPAAGIASLAVAEAPGGRYTILAENDCRACHEGAAVPVLGFSALQLSPDRDPLAAHAEAAGTHSLDLRTLVALGLLRGLPPALLERAPRIDVPSATARAALGYLHGNCGYCHNDTGPLASLDLDLMQHVGARSAAGVLQALVGHASGFHTRPAQMDARRVVPGDSAHSVLAQRMRSRDPLVQMPPLGTQITDAEGLALVEHWIRYDLQTSPEHQP